MTSVGPPTTTTPFDPGAAAAFLDKHAPETLQGLRSEEDAEAVITLGGEPPPSTGLFTPARWRGMAREREEALEQGIRLCNAKIAELRPSLVVSGRWQLATDVLAVLGPASIFGVLKVDFPKPAEYLSGGLTLLALVVAAVTRYVSRSPFTRRTLAEDYDAVIAARAKALPLVKQIHDEIRSGVIGPQNRALLVNIDALCSEIDRLAT